MAQQPRAARAPSAAPDTSPPPGAPQAGGLSPVTPRPLAQPPLAPPPVAPAIEPQALPDHLSRGQAVYEAILNEIRDGVLKAGDRLREQDIAARFGMSRTPVREGLGRLLEKGLVVSAGGRGLVVRALSATEVVDLYAMREIVEGAAARLAAQHAAPPEVAALCDLQRDFAAASDYQQVARINREFHDAVHRSARNAYLDAAIRLLEDHIALLGISTFSVPGRADAATAEHGAIVDAIVARDAERAEQAARAHIRAALRARLTIVDRRRS